MTQEQVASPEQVSKTEPVSETPVSKEEQVTTPLPPEIETRLQQMIAEATQKAVDDAKALGRKELQSQQDRNRAELDRERKRAKFAEKQVTDIESSFGELDEDTRLKMELAKYKSRDKSIQEITQEEEVRKNQEAYTQRLNDTLVDHLKTLGIDPEDKRVDWAKDASDYLSGRSRFDASVAKILKDERTGLEKKLMTEAEVRFKKLEIDFRKEHGLDSVDTTTGSGIEGDDAFRKRMVDPDYVTTKEDLKRIAELQKRG